MLLDSCLHPDDIGGHNNCSHAATMRLQRVTEVHSKVAFRWKIIQVEDLEFLILVTQATPIHNNNNSNNPPARSTVEETTQPETGHFILVA